MAASSSYRCRIGARRLRAVPRVVPPPIKGKTPHVRSPPGRSVTVGEDLEREELA